MAKTIDFKLNEVPGLENVVAELVQDIHDDIQKVKGGAKRDLVITLSFKPDDMGILIKGKAKANLARPEAMEIPDTYGVRENGTIRLDLGQQESMLKKMTGGK